MTRRVKASEDEYSDSVEAAATVNALENLDSNQIAGWLAPLMFDGLSCLKWLTK